MRICLRAAVLCLLLEGSLAVGWSQTGRPPKTSVPAILNNPPDANPQYFPAGIFGDSSATGHFKDFKARWYSSDLRALHEPSFFEAAQDRSVVAYRFLWLRTFHHPIVIRLTILPDGTGSMTSKMTSGAGGYDAGAMIWNKSFDISKAQAEQFSSMLQKAAFWTSSIGGGGGPDGAQWVMEGIQGGVYHIADRWSPQKDDYESMCLFLLSLSKIEVNAKDIY